MKNIVICSDGTGNSAVKGRGTNVFKTYEVVDLNGHLRDPKLRQQIAFYDDGVGTEKLKPLRIIGGAFGWGLARNVRQLYNDLCRVYEPEDQIYLFGFSRGAFTVRTLAGLIVDCGILRREWQSDSELKRWVRKAYGGHRRHYKTLVGTILQKIGVLSPPEEAVETLRGKIPFYHPVDIRFIGVWDTVDAVGFPVVGVARFWNRFIHQFKFPTLDLSPQVVKACHALAIDDERLTFHPSLWEEREGDEERIEQVWFAGVHSNVGGGYPKHGMSLVTLDWMMTKAEREGLRFIPGLRGLYAEQINADDKLYDSRSGLATYYRYKPRSIAGLCREAGTPIPQIHVSAIRRIVLATDGYAPGNLPEDLEIVATDPETPGIDEHHELLRSVSASISKKLREARKDLDKARKWIILRRALHWILVLLTLWVVVWGLKLAPGLERKSTGFGGWLEGVVAALVPGLGDWIAANVVRPFATYPKLGLSVLLVAVAVYYLGLLGRSRIERTYSRFWRRALPKGWRPKETAPPAREA